MDRLSELPDSVIFHIFWLLPMNEVVRTTILSKRWLNLWTTTPFLNFDESKSDSQFSTTDKFRHFVHQALLCWDGVKVLKLKVVANYDESGGDVDLWVRFAKKYEVEELYLHSLMTDLSWTEEDHQVPWVPLYLYSCSSLKMLSIEYCYFRIKGNVQWNQLKSLRIMNGFGVTEDVINQILCGSPQLEVLTMSFECKAQSLCIRSTSLKELAIYNYLYDDDEASTYRVLSIWTPNLKALNIKGIPYTKCLLMNVSSLTHAIAWVKWKVLCASKDEGGLGFKNIEWFNQALVVKWLWRYLTGRDMLWAKIVRSIYGEVEWGETGLENAGKGRFRDGWWPKIVSAAGGASNFWFVQNLKPKVGDGKTFKFWSQWWVGQKPLKFTFPRLFQLSANKEAAICEVGEWTDTGWCWDLRWRRELFEREREGVSELLSLVSGTNLCASNKDGWTWSGDIERGFTTKSAYEAIKDQANETTEAVEETDMSTKVWKIPIPNKVKLTAWRILKNRIPTCDNLSRRNVMLCEVEVGCNACFHRQESTNHLLIHCPKTSKVWEAIFQWLGVSMAQPYDVSSHFQFFTSLSGRKRNKKLLMALWCCTTWLIWKMRNESRFENKIWESANLFGEIKARVWSWGRIFGFVNDGVGIHRWMSNDESPMIL